MYAIFNPQGTLDVPATLITVARRFEKLEKWTVSHVRALEDRMKDVEKYVIPPLREGSRPNICVIDTSSIRRVKTSRIRRRGSN